LVNGAAPATDAISAVNAGNSAVHATVTMTVGQIVAEANSGIGNSVSATAGGASASANIASLMEQSTTLAPTGNAQTNLVDTTGGAVDSLRASNNGVVTALFDAAPAGSVSVSALVGISNSVGATAFGASASAGVNQSVYLSSGVNLTSLFNNEVTTGDITARNHPAGDVTATLKVSGNSTVGNGTVTGPIGDSVSAQAIGAAATASISSDFYRLGTATGSLPTANKNLVTTGNLRAVNRADVTARALLDTGAGNVSSTIVNGVNGFIGASAGGASAGASVSQLVDSSSPNLLNLPGNTVVSGTVIARNTGTVVASLSNPGSATILDSSPGVAAGSIGNSIAAQASGASAGASITSAFNTVSAQTTSGVPSANSVTVTSLRSTNTGPVTARATFGTTASPTTLASIGGGVGNSIGASASGASSVASVNQVINNGVWGGPTPGARLNTVPTNSVTAGSITSINSGAVTARLNTLGTTASTITGGVGNSIGATAIGASAGASVSQIISNVH
jgi:hypothetical protein